MMTVEKLEADLTEESSGVWSCWYGPLHVLLSTRSILQGTDTTIRRLYIANLLVGDDKWSLGMVSSDHKRLALKKLLEEVGLLDLGVFQLTVNTLQEWRTMDSVGKPALQRVAENS